MFSSFAIEKPFSLSRFNEGTSLKDSRFTDGGGSKKILANMVRRNYSTSSLGELVQGLHETIEEARNSQLDLSEVHPPMDSTTYRIQTALRYSCSDAVMKYVNVFGGGFEPDSELLEKILDLLMESSNMFGKFKPVRDYIEGGATFIVQMTSRDFPKLIPPQYTNLMSYELSGGVSAALKR